MPLSAMPKAVILPFEFYLKYLAVWRVVWLFMLFGCLCCLAVYVVWLFGYLAVYVVIWLFGGHLAILLPSMYH